MYGTTVDGYHEKRRIGVPCAPKIRCKRKKSKNIERGYKMCYYSTEKINGWSAKIDLKYRDVKVCRMTDEVQCLWLELHTIGIYTC